MKPPDTLKTSVANPYEAPKLPIRDRLSGRLGAMVMPARGGIQKDGAETAPMLVNLYALAPGPPTLSYMTREQLQLAADGSTRGERLESKEKPFEIPPLSIVQVPGAESWNDNTKDGAHIRSLARSGKPLTPISGTATAYVQPNGIIYYSLGNNGAHTAKAAVLRALGGDTTPLPLHGQLAFVHLTHDTFPLPPQESAGVRYSLLARSQRTPA
ncbi:MAG: hypothetical protein WAQ24_00980 [Candidatus Saccharimonadales bacterium]